LFGRGHMKRKRDDKRGRKEGKKPPRGGDFYNSPPSGLAPRKGRLGQRGKKGNRQKNTKQRPAGRKLRPKKDRTKGPNPFSWGPRGSQDRPSEGGPQKVFPVEGERSHYLRERFGTSKD